MLTVFVDSRMTRRKWYHFVTDARRRVLYRTREFGAVLDWLDLIDATAYMVETDDGHRYRLTVERVDEKEP